MSREYKRSAQDIEWIFATNCLGHQILIMLLLPLLKETVRNTSGDVRIVVTSSSMHQLCRKLDLDLLTWLMNPKPAFYSGIWRYARSKLGDILLTKELSRRLLQAEDKASKRIYVNCFFPGNIVTDQWNTWGESYGKLIGTVLKKVFSVIGQSVQDGAATAVYLAASEVIPEMDLRGQYFVPIAMPNPASPIANNMKLAAEVWASFSISLVMLADCLGLDRSQSNRGTWAWLARMRRKLNQECQCSGYSFISVIVSGE